MGQLASKRIKMNSDKYTVPDLCRNYKLESPYNGFDFYLCINCNKPFQVQRSENLYANKCNYYPIHSCKIELEPTLRPFHNGFMSNDHCVNSRIDFCHGSRPLPPLSTQKHVKNDLYILSNACDNKTHCHNHCCCCIYYHRQCKEYYYNNQTAFQNKTNQSSSVHLTNYPSNIPSGSNSTAPFQEFKSSFNNTSDKPHEYSYQSNHSYYDYQQPKAYTSCSLFHMSKPNEYAYQNDSYHHDDRHQYKKKDTNHYQDLNRNGVQKYKINYVDHKIVMIQGKK
ncbi:unnamed protein product [Cunninghamella blakesleeana]